MLLSVHLVIVCILAHSITNMILQEVPEGRKESHGGPWQFVGLMPLFDPPRHDSAETIRRALNLGVNVKMITGLLISTTSFAFMYQVCF